MGTERFVLTLESGVCCPARSCQGPLPPQSDDPLLAWAVVDCPSAYAIESVDHLAQIVVLAWLTVELREPPRAGERHVVVAWPVGSDTRKHHSASALYDATGRVLAVADALWIKPRRPRRVRRLSRSIRYRLCSRGVKAVFTSIVVSIGRSSEAETRHVCSACSASSRACASSAASVSSWTRSSSRVKPKRRVGCVSRRCRRRRPSALCR